MLESLLLRNFYEGLDKDSAYYLEVANGGSFLHRSPTECWEILDDFMISTDFTISCEPLQEECKSSQEDLPIAESNPSTSTSLDSAVELTPEPRTSEEEEIQPSMFLSQFEDNPSRNNKNTSNFFNTQLREESCSVHTDQSRKPLILRYLLLLPVRWSEMLF